MNDYNYTLDVYTNNSNALIAHRISKNSKVLEFGPAYGRLTKYLHEELGCTVDIVEVNSVAGEFAAKYANNVCLGDSEGEIENYIWEKRFYGNKYDYIIFADVLEHLRDPELVLKRCQLFLCDRGSILCSIPNIAHSSVILALLNDDFTYKDYGLLDRTHISFFTRNTFRTLCKNCGYQIIYENAIKSEVGTNEIAYDYSSVPENIKNVLKLRKNGEAYQYIFELEKEHITSESEYVSSLTESGWTAQCLFRKKDENEFNLLSKVTKHIYSLNNDIYFKLSEVEELEGLCLEPIDSFCFLKLEGIFWGYNSQEVAVNNFTTNGISITDNCFVFLNSIPQIYVTSPLNSVDYIRVKYRVFLYDTLDLKEIADWFVSLKNQMDAIHKEELSKLNEVIKIQEENLKEAEHKCQDLQSERDVLLSEKNSLQSEIEVLNDKLKAACIDGMDLKRQLSHYENLLRNKLFNKREK